MSLKIGTKSTHSVQYKDFGIRLVLSLVAAHVMTAYNEPESFFEVVATESYRRGFIASFVMAFLIVNFIYYITIRLDRLYTWHKQTFLRFLWQVLLGIVAPALLACILVALFFRMYGINIFDTEYLLQDYPLVILMLLMINLYYFALYYYIIATQRVDTVVEVETEDNLGNAQTLLSDEPTYKETIIINTTLKTFPINTDDIAYIYRVSDEVFIRLKSMEYLSESFTVSYSLKELETMLDPVKFFRINRKMIVHFQSITSFHNETPKSLLLSLTPALYNENGKIPFEYAKLPVVSENRTPRFKEWMNR